MFLKSINWIDKDAQEAEIIVSDGKVDILCFSHPFKKNLGDNLTEPIYCLDANGIVVSEKSEPVATRVGSSYSYSVCAKLIDIPGKQVLLGGINLCLEDAHFPADIIENNYIRFSVSRFDLY